MHHPSDQFGTSKWSQNGPRMEALTAKKSRQKRAPKLPALFVILDKFGTSTWTPNGQISVAWIEEAGWFDGLNARHNQQVRARAG